MFTVTLHGPADPQPVGQPVRVAVTVRNSTRGEVRAVGVIDGSEEGTRYPRYRPEITFGGDLVAQPGVAEDPLVGPLLTSDFRRLAPGESFDPCGPGFQSLATFVNFRPPKPGIYRYSLTLSTEYTDPAEWLGRFGQDVQRDIVLGLIENVPRCTVTSLPLEIEIRD